uniref:ELAV-like protein 3 n=1 Tax=Phallusia mammillata TaxID=59560 RepID=A0A6F9DB96_9ASCI|nr:ELAV-like protein 3 [Phallusia mammillata]
MAAQHQQNNPGTNLIVNYLPQCLTDSEFYQLFLGMGPVKSARIIRDRASGYSYGYGFVDYDTCEDATKAIQQLNQHKLYNKTIKVDYSKPSGVQTKNINLYVCGLPNDITEDLLKTKFSPFGTIVQARLVKDKFTGACQGVGFVLFSCRDEAVAAIEGLNGRAFSEGCTSLLNIRFARDQQKPPPQAFLKSPLNQQQTGQKSMWINNNNSYNNMGASTNPVGGGPMRGPGFRGGKGRFSPMATNYNSQNMGYGNVNMGMYNDPSQFNNQNTAQFTNTNSYQFNNMPNMNQPQSSIVFVYGIGPTTTEQQLWELFKNCGMITKVNVIFDQTKGTGKGYGFITFATQQEACMAVAYMNNYVFEGRNLQVSLKT